MISLRAVSLWLLILISLPVSAATKNLKACGHPFYPPVSWTSDHQLHGLAAEVSRQIFSELGYQITFVADYLWKRCLREVELGNADIVVAAYRIPSRESFLEFSQQPVIADHVALFINNDNPIDFNSLDDIKGKTVGLLLGDSFGHQFDQFLLQHTEIEFVARNHQNFAKLAHQRIDFMPLGRLSGQLQSQKLGYHPQISPLDLRVATEYYYLAIGRKSGLAEHLPYINKRLEEMHSDGTIRRLTDQSSRYYLEFGAEDGSQ